MTARRTPTSLIALIAAASGLCLGVAAALAQTATPGMSACPEAGKDGGMVAMQPMGGGGCDNTVFKSDKNAEPSDMLTGKRGTTPVGAKTPAEEQKKRPDGKSSRDGDKGVR